jgi:deoxyribose-phosphate aldolase
MPATATTSLVAADDLLGATAAGSDDALRRFLHGLPGVDQVGAEQRAAALATRSIKGDAKRWALDMVVAMTDLTTLEGADTPGKVRGMCARAIRPEPDDATCPSVAAVCVYPDLVATARRAVSGSGVKVASVATAFPSGRGSVAVKLADVADAVAAGADEIDMVIDRGAFLAGRYGAVFSQVRRVKEACGKAHLKVILETGELATLDNVRRASWLAMAGGADFVKTSTGKVSPAATHPVALVMLEAVRDFAELTGTRVGVKVAGGIRSAKDALRYLVIVNETAGAEWLHPDRFRFGASSLLDDVVMQRATQRTGRYHSADRLAVD